MKRTKLTALLGLAITATVGALSISGSASAWGPERDLFTMAEPATYPVFNSIKDNPTIGDERDFVRVGQINADVTELSNEVEVVPGRQYLVYIYFHNNASSTYNSADYNYSGVAKMVKMATSFGKVITPDTKAKVTGTITSSNTNPLSVWDEAYFTTSSDKVILSYVDGSAKIYSNWGANGSTMPSNLFTENGTALGLNALNGIIPGCEEYHGVVTYVLQADELSGSISKSASKDGKTFYTSLNSLSAGDEITYKLTIRNTGDIALTNATIQDTLPKGLTLVPDTTELWANQSTEKEKLSDNIFSGGFNLGTIGTGNTVYVTYRVKVGEDYGDKCSRISLTNNASLTYDSDQTSGETKTASVTVSTAIAKTCNPGPEPEPDPEPEPEPDPEPEPEPTPPKPGELPNTGPLEITLAVVIVMGILAGGFYYWRTHRTLKSVEDKVSGHDDKNEN